MITANDFRPGQLIKHEDEIYEVVDYQHIKIAQRRAFVRTRLRNIKTGSVLERNFDSWEKFDEVELERRRASFLYHQDHQYVFMDLEHYDQYALTDELVGDVTPFLTENLEVAVLFHENRPFGVEVPKFIELTVTETDPNFRGDTATGSSKPATLETGLVVDVPFFINRGDRIRIDTRTRTYIERAGK